MSQLTQSFYRNVQAICMTDNESDLIRYLSNDGFVLLKQLYSTEIHTTSNALSCRDLGVFLIKLLSHCYSHVSNDDAERALQEIPSIDSIFKQESTDLFSSSTSSNIFETLDYMFNIIVHLFHLPSNHDNHPINISISEIHNIRIEIARAFANLILPPLTIEHKLLWFYQKKLRSLILIFQQILSSQSSSYTNHFTSNPIGSIITTIHHYLTSSSSSSSSFLIQLAFDALQGFALLIENTLGNQQHNRILVSQRRTSNDLLNLMNQYLLSDYFSLFLHLNLSNENEIRARELLEHCSIILKRVKIYRSEEIQRKQNRRIIKTSWENTFQQTCLLHQHQNSFEITLNHRNQLDGAVEMKTHTNEPTTQIKRICMISTLYDKILRLATKQFECNQPSFAFIHDCLGYLISFGSCSCYSLSHYRGLLAKMNHLKFDDKSNSLLEQQSIQLLRQAFLLLSNCSQRNSQYHSQHDNQLADNSLFWTYLASHLFQRSSPYSLKLVRSFPDLIQCCSMTDKHAALRLCVIPCLEHYRTNVSTQTTTVTEIIECLIRALPNLLFDIVIDRSLISLSDTLIALATLFPRLLVHTLPVLGCLLTATCDCSDIKISEPFLQLIIKLTNAWSLSHEAIDNLCHILIILLQKCPTFRSAFYGHQCHLRLYEHFQLMLNNKSTIQSSIIACTLVCISYYPKSNDTRFNHKLIFEQITLYSEKNRYQQSWFELLVRLSLSQQYQDKRTRWKSSAPFKQQQSSELIDDDDSSVTTDSSSNTNYEVEDFQAIDEDEDYLADVESLSEEIPVETMTKQNQTMYSNLILFPQLVILGLEIVWQNVDNEWSDQQNPTKSSIYVTNLVTYLQLLSSLVRGNNYNCVVLKKANIDGYLFTCLTKIVPRTTFTQKDTLISLIITLLQFLWSQSMTVNQLDQCFKLILTHPSLVGPLLRLFKHLVHQIDSNQPRSYCSMPLSSIVTSKSGSHLHLTLDQLLALKYPQLESDIQQSSLSFNTVRQTAFVTETLKSVQIHFPLTVSIWLRVNYPFEKRENSEENVTVREELTKKDYRPVLHILTLQHEGIQLQFWLDSKPNICLKIVQITSAANQQLTDHTIRLYTLPRQSWSHVFLTISKTNNTVGVCLNGQIPLSKKHSLPTLYSSNSNKPWSISLGQQSLDTCTSFYYDLGSILLFDKVDLSEGMNNGFVSTYLYSLGSDHWHFLTAGQQSPLNYWIYQRFTRVHSMITINEFETEQNLCHTTLRRSLIASYSSNNPWTLFLFNTNPDINEEVTTSRLNKILPFRSSTSTLSLNLSSNTSNDDHLLSSATTISLPSKISLEQSSNILNICEQLGGILNFIYLFGKIIEINAYQSPSSICDISDIIFSSIWKIKSYYDLFNSLDGYRLIVKILTTNECTRHINNQFYDILIEKCVVVNQQRLYDVHLFRNILLDWKIWYNHSKIFSLILKMFNDLLSDQSNLKYSHVNRQFFHNHFSLEHLLLLCQELIEEQQEILIEENLSQYLVNIIETLIENDINTIASLMNFVLLIHPLVKTYAIYNKEHFYFIVKPFQYYQQREKYQQENLQRKSDRVNSNSSTKNEDNQNEEHVNLRKSHSDLDLISSIDAETNGTRRNHHITVASITTSKTFPIESTTMINKDSRHQVDYLSTGILKLLTNIALTSPDRLMMKLIDHVFRLNILIVLLLDASMSKRVQCIRLLNNILNRMDGEKVQNDVLRADLHTMLANQIYHQLDGHEDEKQLLEVCVSIALQRPIEFDLKKSLIEQIHDTDQYFSILTSSPPCPRSQVGLALTLAFIEKLSMTNASLCELILNLLEMIISRSNDETRHYLVNTGLTQVLFNTLSSVIARAQDDLIYSVQKCFNTLIVVMFTATIRDEISFKLIIDNFIGLMMMNADIQESDTSKYHRRILHQTLSNMFNSIIDSIEKPSSSDLSFYRSNRPRTSVDEHPINPVLLDNHDRFRKFLHLAIDYIYSFHDECQYLEILTLRLLDISFLGIAYLIEKRSNHPTSRHPISSIIYRCDDIMKPIGQKLLTIALDPDKQRFFFRIQVFKRIIDQPNAKGIMEYLLQNDQQCYVYHQILLYLQILSKTTPNESEIEQMTNPNSSEQSKKPLDSTHLAQPVLNNNDGDTTDGAASSTHTVNISTNSNSTKQLKSASQRSVKSNMSNKPSSSSSTEEDKEVAETPELVNPSPVTDGQENHARQISDRSSSPSLSISSLSSELTPFQQSYVINYQHILKSSRELMERITLPSTTTNDVQQRQGLTRYLLSSDTFGTKNSRRSFDGNASSLKTNSNTLTDRLRRRSQMTISTPLLPNTNWQKLSEQKMQEYASTLNQLIEATETRLMSTYKTSLQNFSEGTIATIIKQAMEITQDVINHQNFERKKFLEHLRLSQSIDLQTKHLWHQLISQLTHEYGVWFEPSSYPKFWELDPTENPQRERRRLQRAYCYMEKRFFQPQIPEEVLVNPPLSYLFDTRHYQSVNTQAVLQRNEKIEMQCRCTNVTPNNEVKGEILVGTTRIYFVPDEQASTSASASTTKTKSINSPMTSFGYNQHSFNDNSNSFSFAIDDIDEMFKRRYLLTDLALELFFINGITLMIAHATTSERDQLYNLLARRGVSHAKPEDKVAEIQTLWKQGYVNNFDYLMQLNKLAGRTYSDLMQYPVYPYVVSMYDFHTLDLRLPSNYRNLSKPIAIQHPEKEEKFIDVYTALEDARAIEAATRQQENDQQQALSIFGHQSDPYHFASLYSNSGIVLHYLVRLLPYTRMFLDYQDNNFDCADRTFHDVRTSYWLSSFESTSDFKEIVPEFYYLHEFLQNKQGFNFGRRQNGEQVSDVVVSAWSKRNARLFVYGLRQALESDHVTMHLHQWIDLIFGCKQTGKAALDAVNVYHAACYYGFPIKDIKDEVIQKAYHGIIRTYGQVPKQLFSQPHPMYSGATSAANSTANDKRNNERMVFESKLPADSIHRQIIGVQWGDFVGSYDMPSPDYMTNYDCPVQVASFVVPNSGSCVICLPPSSLIVYNEHIISESTGEQANSSSTQLDTMIAMKWNTADGIVRCRQLKQMKNWYNFLVPIDDQDKITCCTSIDYCLLFMGKRSGLIEVYRIERNKNAPAGIELIQRCLPFIAHRSSITCLHVNRPFSLLISTSADGMLTLWDTNRLSYVRSFKQDNQTIYHLTSSDTTGDIAYLSSSGCQWHLTYLTCNCDLIGCLTFPEQLNCLCFTSAPEGTSVNVLLGGFENGLILMWSTWDLTLLRQLDFFQLRSHPIVAICVSKVDRRRLYVSDRNRHLHTIESRLSSSTSTSQPPQILFLS